MAILSDILPCGPRYTLLRRFLDDAGLTVIGAAWAAVLITLVVGQPQLLYEQMVYSLCISAIALVLLDGLRLRLLARSARAHWEVPCMLAALAVAPIAHYGGIVIGGTILGTDWPTLAEYPNLRQVSMALYTLLGIYAMGLLIWNRERIRLVEAERQEARLRAETIERQAVQAQLRLLQAQIEPHMLFNTLANLQGLIAIDPAQASSMLDQLIAYLRATLAAARAERTTLAEEFGAAQAYLGLMSVRMGARLTWQCELPAGLRKAAVPAMLLQPLVENAIRHGLEPTIAGGDIQVAASERDGRLEVSVRDTGRGLVDDGPAQEGGGVGLATTRARLAALYGERAALDLVPNAPHGVLARLTLPLETA